MTKDDLLKSASELAPVESEIGLAYAKKIDRLIARINETMLKRPDITDLVGGEANIPMMKDNHGNHVRFVASILRYHKPEVLVDTVLWVFRSYRSRGFHQNYWAAQINTWIGLLKEELSPEAYAAIYPLYHWFGVNIPAFTDLSDEEIANAHTAH